MTKDSSLYERIRIRINKQATAWKIFGKSIPIIVLSILFLLDLFGFAQLSSQLLVIGGAFFFGVACLWWWWAIDVMISVANLMTRATEKFEEVKDEIISVKKDIRPNPNNSEDE